MSLLPLLLLLDCSNRSSKYNFYWVTIAAMATAAATLVRFTATVRRKWIVDLDSERSTIAVGTVVVSVHDFGGVEIVGGTYGFSKRILEVSSRLMGVLISFGGSALKQCL